MYHWKDQRITGYSLILYYCSCKCKMYLFFMYINFMDAECFFSNNSHNFCPISKSLLSKFLEGSKVKLFSVDWFYVFTSGEPLIFIEVALMKNVAQTIQVNYVWTLSWNKFQLHLLINISLFHRKFCGIVLLYLKVKQHVRCSILYHQLRYVIYY